MFAEQRCARTPACGLTARPSSLRKALLLGLAAVALVLPGCRLMNKTLGWPQQPARWWKGNLHTHTLWSDGDDFPEMAVDWYKSHGYDFLAMTDHSGLLRGERWIEPDPKRDGDRALARLRERFGADAIQTRTEGGKTQVRLKTFPELRDRFDEPGRFLLVEGEELSSILAPKYVHVNGFNLHEVIPSPTGDSVTGIAQKSIDAIHAQGQRLGEQTLVQVNHPNFCYSMKGEELAALNGFQIFEVNNEHPGVSNRGDQTHVGVERMWDIVLAMRLGAGKPLLYGTATDDTHNYLKFGEGLANPGRGWVMVRARELTPKALFDAMEAGDFYASTGVELEDIRANGRELRLAIKPAPGVEYRTQFIGTRKGASLASKPVLGADGQPLDVTQQYSPEIGVVLSEVKGLRPSYTMTGDELYVRAKVISTQRRPLPTIPAEVWATAWTQPVQPAAR